MDPSLWNQFNIVPTSSSVNQMQQTPNYNNIASTHMLQLLASQNAPVLHMSQPGRNVVPVHQTPQNIQSIQSQTPLNNLIAMNVQGPIIQHPNLMPGMLNQSASNTYIQQNHSVPSSNYLRAPVQQQLNSSVGNMQVGQSVINTTLPQHMPITNQRPGNPIMNASQGISNVMVINQSQQNVHTPTQGQARAQTLKSNQQQIPNNLIYKVQKFTNISGPPNVRPKVPVHNTLNPKPPISSNLISPQEPSTGNINVHREKILPINNKLPVVSAAPQCPPAAAAAKAEPDSIAQLQQFLTDLKASSDKTAYFTEGTVENKYLVTLLTFKNMCNEFFERSNNKMLKEQVRKRLSTLSNGEEIRNTKSEKSKTVQDVLDCILSETNIKNMPQPQPLRSDANSAFPVRVKREPGTENSSCRTACSDQVKPASTTTTTTAVSSATNSMLTSSSFPSSIDELIRMSDEAAEPFTNVPEIPNFTPIISEVSKTIQAREVKPLMARTSAPKLIPSVPQVTAPFQPSPAIQTHIAANQSAQSIPQMLPVIRPVMTPVAVQSAVLQGSMVPRFLLPAAQSDISITPIPSVRNNQDVIRHKLIGKPSISSIQQPSQSSRSVSSMYVAANTPKAAPAAQPRTKDLVRPVSPNNMCRVEVEDQCHISSSLIESKISDKKTKDMQKVKREEVFCAVSSDLKQSKVIDPKESSYYWCNFCVYQTNHKGKLVNHVISAHRFSCQYCKFQCYSRVDVVEHTVNCHREASSMSKDFRYCLLLPDYLKTVEKIENLDTESFEDECIQSLKSKKVRKGSAHDDSFIESDWEEEILGDDDIHSESASGASEHSAIDDGDSSSTERPVNVKNRKRKIRLPSSSEDEIEIGRKSPKRSKKEALEELKKQRKGRKARKGLLEKTAGKKGQKKDTNITDDDYVRPIKLRRRKEKVDISVFDELDEMIGLSDSHDESDDDDDNDEDFEPAHTSPGSPKLSAKLKTLKNKIPKGLPQHSTPSHNINNNAGSIGNSASPVVVLAMVPTSITGPVSISKLPNVLSKDNSNPEDSNAQSTNSTSQIETPTSSVEIQTANSVVKPQESKSTFETQTTNSLETQASNSTIEAQANISAAEFPAVNSTVETQASNTADETQTSDSTSETQVPHNSAVETNASDSALETNASYTDGEMQASNSDGKVQASNSDGKVQESNSDGEVQESNSDGEMQVSNTNTKTQTSSSDAKKTQSTDSAGDKLAAKSAGETKTKSVNSNSSSNKVTLIKHCIHCDFTSEEIQKIKKHSLEEHPTSFLGVWQTALNFILYICPDPQCEFYASMTQDFSRHMAKCPYKHNHNIDSAVKLTENYVLNLREKRILKTTDLEALRSSLRQVAKESGDIGNKFTAKPAICTSKSTSNTQPVKDKNETEKNSHAKKPADDDAMDLDTFYKCAFCSFKCMGNPLTVRSHSIKNHPDFPLYTINLKAVEEGHERRFVLFCVGTDCHDQFTLSKDYFTHIETCEKVKELENKNQLEKTNKFVKLTIHKL